MMELSDVTEGQFVLKTLLSYMFQDLHRIKNKHFQSNPLRSIFPTPEVYCRVLAPTFVVREIPQDKFNASACMIFFESLQPGSI